MADINEIITLGIGTPSDIPHFILLGLSPGSVVPIVVVSLSEISFLDESVNTPEFRAAHVSLPEFTNPEITIFSAKSRRRR